MTNPIGKQRRRIAVAVIGAALILGAVLVGEAAMGGPKYPAIPDQEMSAQLQAAGNNLVSGNLATDATIPSSAEVVEASRGKATAATTGDSDNLDPEAPVYVVQVEGDFVGCMAKTPEPTSITGGGLVFIFDAGSGQVTDWRIVTKPIALTGLGEVSSISLDPSPRPCTEGSAEAK